MVSVGNHLESVRAFKAHVPSKHMSSSGSLESANDAKQRRIDELEERVDARMQPNLVDVVRMK